MQQALNRLGYFAGPVDGLWDRLTADAMVHFQEAHELEPTGNLNFSSIAAMGLWENLIGHPIGSDKNLLKASTGAPPPRGNGKTVIGGEPATSYSFALGAQLAVGLFTAVVSPAIASLAGDFFPPETRAAAYGLILAGELFGSGVGFVWGSEFSSVLDWRWPFFLAAVPGALFLLVLWRWLPEPARGGQSWIELGQRRVPNQDDPRQPRRERRGEEVEDKAAEIVTSETGAQPRGRLVLREEPANLGLFRTMGYLVRIPTYTLLIIASSLAYYVFGGIRGFGMIYFTQHYGISRSTLGWLIIPVGLAGIVGGIASGRISEWLLRRGWATIRITLPGIALFATVLLLGGAIG